MQERLRRVALLIVDELGFVPFEKAGGEMLFDVLSSRHEPGGTVITEASRASVHTGAPSPRTRHSTTPS